jgi:hypothetical protein
MAAAPSNFLSIVLSLFLFASRHHCRTTQTKHRLRPIDAGNRNELPAIFRDQNVIIGGCNAIMRSPQAPAARAAVHHSPRPYFAIPVKRDSQSFHLCTGRAATKSWRASAPLANRPDVAALDSQARDQAGHHGP